MDDQLEHYGMPRRSGRYPWGSGELPFQRSGDFLSYVEELRGQGMSDVDISKKIGISTTEFRKQITSANASRRQDETSTILSLKERGYSNIDIANKLNISEGSVRNRIKESGSVKLSQLDNITNELRSQAEKNGYLDIGKGVEIQMGISREKLLAAANRLVQEEGYTIHNDIYVKQVSDPSKYTTFKVLTKEPSLDVVKQHQDEIRPPDMIFEDGGLTTLGLKPIQMVDWSRIDIRYKEDGGEDKDGLIELRPGVKDLDLQGNKYAQVRIGVGDNHYLKGMSIYGKENNFPKGKDIIFYTNKPKSTPKEKVLKELKDNPNNPFGATIKRGRQFGALNMVNEEGDWAKWSNTLSGQFLSKQPAGLIKERLDDTWSRLQGDYAEIMSLTNPAVKKYLLNQYADGLGSKARHLKVQAMPNMKGHVILPFPTMKTNEVYAPNYKNGDKVVLVRYPHAGTFELPELTVNNRGPAKGLLGNTIDAIGIHPSVAQKLSGADFDGDSVWVIPNNQGKVKTSRSLKELKNFDPNQYKVDDPPKIIKDMQMGGISNLITDMTLDKRVTQSEIARAVKHSMVVIDAEKHGLDWKQSAKDNNIQQLKHKYQKSVNPVTGKRTTGQASTIISRSRSDSKLGKKMDVVYDRDKTVRAMSSGSAKESLYVSYIDRVKGLQNTSYKQAEKIPNIKRDPKAAKKYKAEVDSLNTKLNKALSNAPRERQAQLMATDNYYKNLDKGMSKDDRKKLKSQSLATARVKTNAKRDLVDITDREWEAIQNNAISQNKMMQILKNSDQDKIKQLSMPKQTGKMSTAKMTRAKSLLNRGYTYAEVSEALGVSTTTIRKALE